MSSDHTNQQGGRGGLTIKPRGYPVLTTGPMMMSVPQTKVSIRPGPNVSVPTIPGMALSPHGVVSPRGHFAGMALSPMSPGGLIGGPSIVAAKASEYAPGGILAYDSAVDYGSKRSLGPVRNPLVIPGMSMPGVMSPRGVGLAMSPRGAFLDSDRYSARNELRRLKEEYDQAADGYARRDISREMRDIIQQMFPYEFWNGIFDDRDEEDLYHDVADALSDRSDDRSSRPRRFGTSVGRDRRSRSRRSILDRINGRSYPATYSGAGVMIILDFTTGTAPAVNNKYVVLAQDGGNSSDFIFPLEDNSHNRRRPYLATSMAKLAATALEQDTGGVVRVKGEDIMAEDNSFDVRFASGDTFKTYIVNIKGPDASLIFGKLNNNAKIRMSTLRVLTDEADIYSRNTGRSRSRSRREGSTKVKAFTSTGHTNVNVHNAILRSLNSASGFRDALRNADGSTILTKDEGHGKFSLNKRN